MESQPIKAVWLVGQLVVVVVVDVVVVVKLDPSFKSQSKVWTKGEL